MTPISESTAKFLEDTDKWLAQQTAAGHKESLVKTYGIIPFTVTLVIGLAALHFIG